MRERHSCDHKTNRGILVGLLQCGITFNENVQGIHLMHTSLPVMTSCGPTVPVAFIIYRHV
jgi:hypothetical protein